MNNRILSLGIAQGCGQGTHPLEVEIGLGKFRGFFQAIINKGIKIVKGLIVGGFGVHTGSIVIGPRPKSKRMGTGLTRISPSG